MYTVAIDTHSNTPVYQQIVDCIHRDIHSGTLLPGVQLPTVRALADTSGLSRGTVKHAYDALEQLGLIEKRQGRGSFVRSRPEQGESKKDTAMSAIDSLLDQMEELGFSSRDTRILLDLKMREREQSFPNVQLGAVDCSPEALASICRQLSTIPHVDIARFLLQPVLEAPQRFDPGLDLVITTPSHFQALQEKTAPGCKVLQTVLAVSPSTVSRLARISPAETVGILCASRRFADIITRGCQRYSVLEASPEFLEFGDPEATREFLQQHRQLILPRNWSGFCTPEEETLLRRHKGPQPVIYDYRIDRGSLLYLGEEIGRIYASKQTKE